MIEEDLVRVRPPEMAMSDVTQILSQIEQGDLSAAEQLLPLVYDEMRNLAGRMMKQERPGQTLQATALVHEAFLRLVDVEEAQRWSSRGKFFAAAAEAMRRILIEQARRKKSLKRGGGVRREPLQPVAAPEVLSSIDLLALNEALEQLEAAEPDKATLVKLRFFAGLSLQESAQALGISVATAKRHWVYARAWLYGRLGSEP